MSKKVVSKTFNGVQYTWRNSRKHGMPNSLQKMNKNVSLHFFTPYVETYGDSRIAYLERRPQNRRILKYVSLLLSNKCLEISEEKMATMYNESTKAKSVDVKTVFNNGEIFISNKPSIPKK